MKGNFLMSSKPSVLPICEGSEFDFDLIIATYNRSDYLRKTIKSIEELDFPLGLRFRLIVSNNNSSPEHTKQIEAILAESKLHWKLLFEPRQGKSYALNQALGIANAPLIGFVDDDETVASDWLQVAMSAMEDTEIGFIGGSCIPVWETDPPSWLPALGGKFRGVVGWIDHGDKTLLYDDQVSLNGGNLIVRKTCFDKVGVFATNLGRSAKGLMGGEETDLHRRLLGAGLRGLFLPNLVIYHYVPSKRLSLKYHLRWAFDAGRSESILYSLRIPIGRHFLGIPGYKFKRALKNIGVLIKQSMRLQFKSPVTVGSLLEVFSFFGWIAARFQDPS